MLPIMPSSHLIEPQEAISHAVQRLLALPEESSRRIFLEGNPQLQLQDMVLYLATQVPKIARDTPDRALRLGGPRRLAAAPATLGPSSKDNACRPLLTILLVFGHAPPY